MSDTTFLISGGFFDAVDSDRLYSADQMNQPYKKLIHDGINREADGTTPGFAVTAGGGMNVLVATGNAMIGGKWAENKAVQTIAVAGNTSGSARIDSIILQCDKSRAVRAVQIVYRQGTTAAPDLVSDDDITELRLANIRVPSAASAIASENITDTRGGAECPWVRSVFDAPDARYIVEEYTESELAGAYQTVKSAVDSIRYAAQSGQPTVALQASDMIDSNLVYLYQGSETGYSTGYLYYYSDAAGAWIRGAQYGASVVDTALDEDSENPVQNKAIAVAIKTVRSFVVEVPGSAAAFSGSIAAGDFAKALATYTAGSGVYAVKDGEVYQLSAASSSTMTFTQMYHGTMNFIKQIQITSADTFTVTNTALSSSAADTSYNNTTSGLTATDVQAAIDENAAAVTNVNGRLGKFNFFDSMQSGFIPTSGTSYPTTNESYPNATYSVIDLLKGQSLVLSGFASANSSGRARCIVNGEIVSSVSANTENYTTTANLSNGLNNCKITAKKDIQIALMMLNGIKPSGALATLDGYGSISEMLIDTYDKTFSLEKTTESLSDEVDGAVGDLEGLAEKTFDISDIQYPVPNIPNINYAPGCSVSAGATSIQLDTNANYDSYWYITSKPLTLYAVPTSGQYYALAVLTDAIGTWEEHTSYKIIRGTAGARYRASDNNLPTQASPLTVPAGTMIVYTFPASNYGGVVYKEQLSNILNNAVRLNDGQLAQIGGQKKVYFKYTNTSGGDSSNEHVDVYIPYKDGFIHYLVVHTELQSINSDVWRISLAYIADSAFNDVTQITTSGEWECAIHMPDRDDFSGGYAHGDEVLINAPTFYKDGLPITITDYTDFTECEEFTFVERTNMYDPADSTRGIAQHGSAHIFNTENLKIQQSILWLVDTALTNTYLAMLPIAKAVSHSFYTNARHIVTTIGNTNHTESKATEAVIYGNDICCKFSVPVYSPVSAYFFETDNGGSAYNKCYFAVATTSATHGDIWMTETDYEFV